MIEPRYSSRAHRDVVEITRHICRDNPTAAVRVVDQIELECRRVTMDPTRGVRHDELPDEYRVVVVGSYLIVYRTDDRGALILRVVHGARDLGRLFPKD